MAEIYDLASYRAAKSPHEVPPTRNQEILAQIQAQAKVADTPEARLLNELRGMEETLLGKHRQYARLWEAADRLGINPPVRTGWQILADAEGMFPQGTPPLPPAIEPRHAWPSEIAEANRQNQPGQAQSNGPEIGRHTGNGHDDGHSM